MQSNPTQGYPVSCTHILLFLPLTLQGRKAAKKGNIAIAQEDMNYSLFANIFSIVCAAINYTALIVCLSFIIPVIVFATIAAARR